MIASDADVALELRRPGDLRRRAYEAPAPGHGEVVVAVRAVGISGSDLQWFTEGGIGGRRGGAARGSRAMRRVVIEPAAGRPVEVS